MLNNLFRTILEVTMTTSAVGLLLLLLTPLLRRIYSVKWRYWAWLILAVRLLVPLNITLPSPPVTLHAPTQALPYRVQSPAQPVDSPASAQQIPQQGAMPEPYVPQPSSRAALDTTDLLAILWLTGSVCVLGWQVCAYGLFRRTVRRHSKAATRPEVSAAFDQLKQELSIAGPIQLAVCSLITSPMMTGFIKPVILLPNENYTSEELDAILRHEMIHCRRGDLWYKLILLCANAIHWFNPVVWAMTRAANRDLEIACDEEAVRDGDITYRKQYSQTILAVVRKEQVKITALSTSFYGGKRILRARLAGILDQSAKRRGIVAISLLLACSLLVGGLVACSEPRSQNWLKPIEMSAEEKQLLQLTGGYSEMDLFSYSVDDPIQSVEFWLERYDNGVAQEDTNGFLADGVGGTEGKISVSCVKTDQQVNWRIALQDDGGTSSSQFTTDLSGQFSGYSQVSLQTEMEILPDQELLLSVLYCDLDGNLTAYTAEEIAEHPEQLAVADCAYLVKCRFATDSNSIRQKNKTDWSTLTADQVRFIQIVTEDGTTIDVLHQEDVEHLIDVVGQLSLNDPFTVQDIPEAESYSTGNTIWIHPMEGDRITIAVATNNNHAYLKIEDTFYSCEQAFAFDNELRAMQYIYAPAATEESPSVLVTKETDPVEIAKQLFRQQQDRYIGENVVDYYRILSYQIDDARLFAGDLSEFAVRIKYRYTLPDSWQTIGTGHISANGLQVGNEWSDCTLELRVRQYDAGHFIVEDIGTGGGGQGLQPVGNPGIQIFQPIQEDGLKEITGVSVAFNGTGAVQQLPNDAARAAFWEQLCGFTALEHYDSLEDAFPDGNVI
ncbi:M56 family metallopeptidase [Ligaoa zhengdingensis]|uniref:M56 family metallopeptidase n=1 Tax=Ligaoa zhengdingensis TaxID=2763658 RepID=UPI0031BA2880